MKFPFFKISEIKNGAPKNDIIIPAGISCGEKIVRAIVSAKITKIAPEIIDAGTKNFAEKLNFFEKMRKRWGAMIPTKFIVPPAQTAQLVLIETENKMSILKNCTFKPSVFALFSPVIIKSSGELKKIIIITEDIPGIKMNLSSFQPRPLKLPKIHE